MLARVLLSQARWRRGRRQAACGVTLAVCPTESFPRDGAEGSAVCTGAGRSKMKTYLARVRRPRSRLDGALAMEGDIARALSENSGHMAHGWSEASAPILPRLPPNSRLRATSRPTFHPRLTEPT